MELKNAVINILGDSITEGVGASSEENRYTDVFARMYGAKVNNYGVSGSRIANQRIKTQERHEAHFCMRMEEMDLSADAVVVFGGTNDYGHGDAPLGAFTDRTPDTFYGACHYLMSGLVQRYCGKPIVIMSPLHRLNERIPRATAETASWRFARRLRAIARSSWRLRRITRCRCWICI